MGIESALGAIKAVAGVISSVLRRFSRTLADPGIRIAYERAEPSGETITLSILHYEITKIIVEPGAEVRLAIDPPEIPSLLPGQSVRCSIYVEEGPPEKVSVTTLVHFLGKRSSARMRVCFRFTDPRGQRLHIPFFAEKVGAHHEVHWTPGKVARASPDW
ncbi:MAG: hypothetical protein ACLPY2_10885 [Bryobacteraceae bacterium]|jgi:hypothetical protein